MIRHTLLALVVIATAAVAEAPAPGARETFICHARSVLGRRYTATGENEKLTQEAAMQKCEASARRCYPTGCSNAGER